MLRDRIFPAFFYSFTQGNTKRAQPPPAGGDNLFGKLLTDVKNRAGAEVGKVEGWSSPQDCVTAHESPKQANRQRISQTVPFPWNLCSLASKTWPTLFASYTDGEFLVMSKSHNQCLNFDEAGDCNGNPAVPRPLLVNNSLELHRYPNSWPASYKFVLFLFRYLSSFDLV